MAKHIPVLLKEVIHYLHPEANQNFVDGTFGAGGHAEAILRATAPNGRLFVFDIDPEAVARASIFGSRVRAFNENFSLIKETLSHVDKLPFIHGILFDLGVSSRQLDDKTLGLSFLHEAPLDMRLTRSGAMTAGVIINRWSEDKLAKIFYDWGEEKASRRIASIIVKERKINPIQTTTALAEIISKVKPRGGRRIHPATQVFQALRIAVNDELSHLRKGIDSSLQILVEGGRLAVISFHSLEDRIVKRTFREAAKICHCPPTALRCVCGREPHFRVLTKKAIKSTDDEIKANPRARSARLRVIEKGNVKKS